MRFVSLYCATLLLLQCRLLNNVKIEPHAVETLQDVNQVKVETLKDENEVK